MRRISLVVFLLLVSSVIAHSATVTLTWDYVQGLDPAVQFTMYRQDGCVGDFVGIGQVAYPTLTFVDTTVLVGNTYCWQVTARDANGLESTPSNVVQFQVQAPAPPTNLRGVVGP